MNRKTIYNYDEIIPSWNESFEIGIDSIDREHHFFLDLIKEICEASKREAELSLLSQYIDQLILYARFHFFSEELFMQQLGYPRLQEHKILHQQLLGKLSDQVTLFQLKKVKMTEVLGFLIDWFKYHTLVEDKKISEFMK